MKKLIFFPGNIESSFIQNELSYYESYFDEVVVFNYGKEIKKAGNSCESFGFKYYSMKDAALVNPYMFFKWLTSQEVWREMRENFGLSLSSLKKMFYILYYGYYYIKFEKMIQKEIDSFQGEIYLYSYWLTRTAYTIAKFSNYDSNKIKSIVSRAHCYDLYLEDNLMNYLPFRRFIEQSLDSIAFISQQGCDYFKKYISVGGREKCKARQYVSRLGTFNDREICNKGLGKSKIVIASCSSIISVKRLDLIIEVISKFTRKKVKWIHIGKGIEENKIKRLAKQKLEAGSYKFLGEVQNKNILDIYLKYNVDFFINLSDSEGIPVSIMEALSMGIPIIARNIGGISEIVTEDTGLLLPGKWTKKELGKIVVFIEKMDEKKYRELSMSCIDKWNKLYNADNNYRGFFAKMIE